MAINVYPNGTIRNRTLKKVTYAYVKTDNGWRPVARVTPYAQPNIKEEKEIPIKKVQKVYPTRPSDKEGYHYVRLDARTEVLRKI